VSQAATPGWHNAIDGTDRWDAGWFQQIARVGYGWNPSSAAFFPGYPLAIRAVAASTPVGEQGAALAISNASYLVSLVVLYGLTSMEFSRAFARRTLPLLAFFPLAFFFMAPYSESLFFLSSLLTFWWGRRRRWLLAAGAAFLAAATRNAGILLVPVLLVEAWHEERSERHAAIAFSLTPLLAPMLYGAYWLFAGGDLLRPLHAESTWSRFGTLPIMSLGNALALAIAGATSSHGRYWTADLVFTASLLIPFVFRWRILPRSYLIYIITSVLVVLSSTTPYRPLVSTPRYLMIVFPLFWTACVFIRRRAYFLVLGVSVACFSVMAVLFMNWGIVP
jgi:hypothetical protein